MEEIVLSKKASHKLDELLSYLETEWSTKAKNDFITKLDKSLNRIRKFPNSCPEISFAKGIHILVVTKQTSVFYRHNAEVVTIISVYDNRMNPDRIKKDTE